MCVQLICILTPVQTNQGSRIMNSWNDPSLMGGKHGGFGRTKGPRGVPPIYSERWQQRYERTVRGQSRRPWTAPRRLAVDRTAIFCKWEQQGSLGDHNDMMHLKSCHWNALKWSSWHQHLLLKEYIYLTSFCLSDISPGALGLVVFKSWSLFYDLFCSLVFKRRFNRISGICIRLP